MAQRLRSRHQPGPAGAYAQVGRTCSPLLRPYKMADTPPATAAVVRPGSSFGSPSSPSGRLFLRQVHRTTFVDFILFSRCLPWVLAPGHPCLRQSSGRYTRPSPQHGDGRTPSQPRQRAAQLGLQQDAAECRKPPGKVCPNPSRPTPAGLTTDGRPASTKAPAWTRRAPAPKSKSGRWRRSSRWPGPSTDAWPRRRPRAS